MNLCLCIINAMPIALQCLSGILVQISWDSYQVCYHDHDEIFRAEKLDIACFAWKHVKCL